MSATANALSPVATAIYNALNVSALLALAPGGVHSVVPQNTMYPFVLFEVNELRNLGGFGTWPGHQDMPEIEVRLHGFSNQTSIAACQAVVGQAVTLVFETSLVVDGFTVCSDKPLTDIQVLNLGDQVIAGVTIHEEVAILRLIVERT